MENSIERATAIANHNLIQARLIKTWLTWLEEDDRGVALPTTEFAFRENRSQPDVAVLLKEKWAQLTVAGGHCWSSPPRS